MITLEIGTQRAHRGTVQFYVVGEGDRTDDMISFDGIRFSSNGGPVDWDEIKNADEASAAARAALARAGQQD
jgi:hypothetical protein